MTDLRRRKRASGSGTEREGQAVLDRLWGAYARQLLLSEMMRRGISYGVLAERLAALGIVESEAVLRDRGAGSE